MKYSKVKAACSAYIFYVADFRKKWTGTSAKPSEIVKQAADGWKKLSEDEKKPYYEMAAADH